MCSKEQRQKRNYLIHLLYVRKEFDECTMLIDDTLEQVLSRISLGRLFVSLTCWLCDTTPTCLGR